MIPSTWGSPGGRVLQVGGHHLGGFGIAGGVLGLILWVAVVIALVLLIMTLIRGWRRPYGSPAVVGPSDAAAVPGPSGASPEAHRILEERYARGEINHDEYLERKKDLTGS